MQPLLQLILVIDIRTTSSCLTTIENNLNKGHQLGLVNLIQLHQSGNEIIFMIAIYSGAQNQL